MFVADVLKHPDPRDWEHGVRPKYRVSLWRSVVSRHRFDWRCGWRSRSVGYVCCCSFSDITKGKHYTNIFLTFYLSLIFINIKGIVHSKICWEFTHPRDIQDVEEFVSSSEQIWRNVALHLLLSNGCSAVNGCRHVKWWTGVMRITCGLLWCFYQLFGLSFWRHPFTAEHPLVNNWCNATFLQISSEGEHIFSKFSFLGELVL